MEAKKSLITKLEQISALYKTTLSIKNKSSRFTATDNYTRKVYLPPFPGEYRSEEEREAWKKSTDHCADNAISSMDYIYDRVCKPKEPQKPEPGIFPTNEHSQANELKKKEGWKVLVAGFVAFCVLISGGLFSGEALTVIFNLILLGVCGAVLFLFFKKLQSSNKADEESTRMVIENYNKFKAQAEAKYESDMTAYKTAMDSHALKKTDFIKKYTEWRKVYLLHIEEEKEIAEMLEADRVAEVKRIFEEEYLPAENKLKAYNDLVSENYLPVLDDIISLIKDGRADDYKEAVNLYEEISYRERQLVLEREKEEQRKHEAALKREAEERHHREQMDFQKEQERQRAREIEKQQDLERQRIAEEQRHNAAQEREMKNKQDLERRRITEERRQAEASRQKRCWYCAHQSSCGLKSTDGAYNCTGFTPK
ncbi:MAG: hypothetical protein E7652_07815 [Ruminococcaceae bacterium]|nr:hypothetical protein [Oscillospiraceae bacterium]